ncbi:hypothetical protein CEN44_27330 [Fischerella muscicola CCMEE 5323]|uniref:Uncharacterized protein n=1 Tax=Fischerella muscicola CCMEE 5323 TaxID=2019572 RepID=A0A2N6JV70_FISMU|nr:hypothetical protein CEN44_27330 [Fischerella muscicola CCMEE 5323]
MKKQIEILERIWKIKFQFILLWYSSIIREQQNPNIIPYFAEFGDFLLSILTTSIRIAIGSLYIKLYL